MGSWCLCRRTDGRTRHRSGQKFIGISSAELETLAQREGTREAKGRERVRGGSPRFCESNKGREPMGKDRKEVATSQNRPARKW